MKVDASKAETRLGSRYPAPYDEPCRARKRVRLGLAGGLTQYGVNRLHLEPGAWSSQRHWHTREDEFVYVLEGEVVLITDQGEEVLRAGDCAAFPHGVQNGHHLQNRSDREAVLLEVGTTDPADAGDYPDIDMRFTPDGFVHKDGTPYPGAATGRRKRVLLIGLTPEVVDFSQVPGMDEPRLRAGLQAALDATVAAGFEAEWCLIGTEWAAAETMIRGRLAEKDFDAVLIGAGIRTLPPHLVLFERILNLVHQAAPRAQLCFNTSPDSTREAVLRWLTP